MAINSKWARWTFASVCKHFDYSSDGVVVYIEGQKRNTRGESEFFELRMDGPIITEVSKNLYKMYIEVNILIQVIKNDSNFQRIHELVGIALTKMHDFNAYKYGPSSDGTFFTCFKLLQKFTGQDRVWVNHFGQIDVKVPLLQATVEGHFEALVEGE